MTLLQLRDKCRVLTQFLSLLLSIFLGILGISFKTHLKKKHKRIGIHTIIVSKRPLRKDGPRDIKFLL